MNPNPLARSQRSRALPFRIRTLGLGVMLLSSLGMPSRAQTNPTAEPLPAVKETSRYREDSGPAGYTWCANEGGSYAFSQSVDVAYGANGQFSYKQGVTGTITFDNATFGDPIYGVVKSGYYKARMATNVALGKPTSQSSTAYGDVGDSSHAVDGNTNGYWTWDANSVTHTHSERKSWWQVNLGASHQVNKVILWNRTDCCGERLSNFHVDYLDATGQVIATQTYAGTAGATTDINLSAMGVYAVRVQLHENNPVDHILSLAEVQVFGTPDGNDAPTKTVFIVKTNAKDLTISDYQYLSLIPVSKRMNKGIPSILSINSENDLNSNEYLKDYLRRYQPDMATTINFEATVPYTNSTNAKNSNSPLELSVSMALSNWKTADTVVFAYDEISETNYPNVLQASALAAILNAPLLYYNDSNAQLVKDAIRQLGSSVILGVSNASQSPIAIATRTLSNPVEIYNYLKNHGMNADYFATTNPKDINLNTGSKLSLTAPFVAARRNGIVVPITSYTPNLSETIHYTGYPAIKGELKQLYQAISRYPDYLALVGDAHSIPLSYRCANDNPGQDFCSPADLDYSEVDDGDVFPDIAIGRIMSYDIFDATLLTSRTSTYEQLFDGAWEKMMADVGGQWDSSYLDALGANYGFSSTNLVGKLNPTQPVEAAIIGHNDHSHQHTLGGAFDVNSVNILAPAAIFSNGCATAAIDLDYYNLLVVNRLLKLGAVAFVGSTRTEPGAGKMKISGMMNALLAGEPLGRCYMAGINTMSWNGADDQRWNCILLGDPGLKIHVPAAPAVAPTNHALTTESSNTDILTVNVPSTLFTPEVDRGWCNHWGLTYPTYWGEKAGLYGMDVDRFYLVRFTPPKPVLSVEELDTWPTVNSWVWGNVKLGMMGNPTIDYQQDGTQQLVWAIRANIMDWPSSQSTVPLAAMTSDRFRITYAPK